MRVEPLHVVDGDDERVPVRPAAEHVEHEAAPLKPVEIWIERRPALVAEQIGERDQRSATVLLARTGDGDLVACGAVAADGGPPQRRLADPRLAADDDEPGPGAGSGLLDDRGETGELAVAPDQPPGARLHQERGGHCQPPYARRLRRARHISGASIGRAKWAVVTPQVRLPDRGRAPDVEVRPSYRGQLQVTPYQTA
jgi:hypothetical protein